MCEYVCVIKHVEGRRVNGGEKEGERGSEGENFPSGGCLMVSACVRVCVGN